MIKESETEKTFKLYCEDNSGIEFRCGDVVKYPYYHRLLPGHLHILRENNCYIFFVKYERNMLFCVIKT